MAKNIVFVLQAKAQVRAEEIAKLLGDADVAEMTKRLLVEAGVPVHLAVMDDDKVEVEFSDSAWVILEQKTREIGGKTVASFVRHLFLQLDISLQKSGKLAPSRNPKK